ncbi:carboxypeptidase regulatory-like domain-containing protein, partial [Candidatus Aerophobetes bacterium]
MVSPDKFLVKGSKIMKLLLKAKGAYIVAVVLLLAAGSITAGWADTLNGTISGAVTNSLTGSPLSAATVTTDPTIEGVSIKTDARGNYTATLPIGIYRLTFEKANFESSTQMVVAIGGQTAIKNVSLKPTSAVVVNAGKDQSSSPGKTLTLKATTKPLDGSTVTDYKWTQIAGAAAVVKDANSQTATVTLADPAAYKEELF